MSLLEGFTLEEPRRKLLHEKLGRELSTEVYAYQMAGHRIMIVPEPVSERTKGLLYKPRSAVERQQLEMGAGWVVAVGPLVGAPGAPHPVGVVCEHPSDMLGRHVIFRFMTGINLRTSDEDTEFGGQYALIVLTDRDILAVGDAGDGV